MNKYIFNFQGFDTSLGVIIKKIVVNDVLTVLGSSVTIHNMDELVQFIQLNSYGIEGLSYSSNSISFYSSLNLSNVSTGYTLFFTYNAVDYIIKSDGSIARTKASFDSTPNPSYTSIVTISKSAAFPSGFLRLMISGKTVFFGDTIAFCKKYNRTYTVDDSGNITVQLSYPNPTIQNPFSTLTKLTQLFNDIMELASYGVGNVTNTWSASGSVLSMVGVYNDSLYPAILCNVNYVM